MGKDNGTKKCYNPYHQFIGVFIPNWLLKRKELSFGAKIVFGVLTKATGVNGKGFIGREAIAKDLAVTSRSVQKYLNELYDYELVIAEPRSHTGGEGTGGTNKYMFLDHPWISWKNKETVHFEMLEECSPGVVKDSSGGVVKNWVYPQVVKDSSGGVVKNWVNENPNLPQGSEEFFTRVVKNSSLHIKEILKDILKENPKRENQIVDNFYFFEAAGLNAAEETKAFELFITSYPKNPHLMNLHQLRHSWVKRRKENHTSKKLIGGAKWFRECCRIKNLIGERYVMGINRFIGEEKNFLNDWEAEYNELRRSQGYNPRN